MQEYREGVGGPTVLPQTFLCAHHSSAPAPVAYHPTSHPAAMEGKGLDTHSLKHTHTQAHTCMHTNTHAHAH